MIDDDEIGREEVTHRLEVVTSVSCARTRRRRAASPGAPRPRPRGSAVEFGERGREVVVVEDHGCAELPGFVRLEDSEREKLEP